MKNIWLCKEELEDGNNYLYGDGYNAKKMFLIFRKYNIPVNGFIRAYTTDENELMGLPIVNLEEIIDSDVNILITQNKWMDIYDRLSALIFFDKIYTLGNWEEAGECIVCKKKKTIRGGGEFVPFLKERMFLGREAKTAVIHCSNCWIYYSEYRPTDDEMALLYSGYRDEIYQKQRQKFEKNYTMEFNQSLYDPRDVDGRKEAIYRYISGLVDVSKIEKWNTILDFGGDKGQFIPDQWSEKRRIVYEISAPEVVSGVELIDEYAALFDLKPDLIMCNQVMEHVSDVRGYFERLVQLLPNGAYLYIEVPNERWCVDQEYVRFHEHISFFSEKTFKVLAEQFGVFLIDVRVQDGNVIRALFTK